MNTKVLISKVFPIFTLIFVGPIGVIAQAPSFKYNVEYVCGKERVVVRYCRRDSDRPGEPRTPDGANYCHVEYLDRPSNVPSIPFFAAELQSDMAAKLTSCKDPLTGKAPAGGNTTTANSAAADPSIAKALAAKVDINIVGMRFGDPLRLPNCPFFQLAPLTQNCFTAGLGMATDIAKELGIENTVHDDVKIITLTTNHCPSWVTGCLAYVTVHDGKLDGVSLFTNGRNSASVVTRDLTAKYGKPTRIKAGTVTPDVGNPFKVNDPEWDLPGLRVRYETVRLEDDGSRVQINEGIVRIMTEAENQRRLKKQNAPVKNKL